MRTGRFTAAVCQDDPDGAPRGSDDPPYEPRPGMAAWVGAFALRDLGFLGTQCIIVVSTHAADAAGARVGTGAEAGVSRWRRPASYQAARRLSRAARSCDWRRWASERGSAMASGFSSAPLQGRAE